MNSLINETKRIAVLTCYKSGHYITSNALLVSTFEKQSLRYEEVVWDTPGIPWSDYDAVLIRETWDYVEEIKYQQFINLVDEICRVGVPIYNPPAVITWNSKKTYLSEIKSLGINCIDSIITSRSKSPNILPLLNQLGGDEFVIKPVIAAGAHKTARMTLQSAQEIYQSNYGLNEEVLIQPFFSEILNKGDLSFVFFNGLFSHAVKKLPAPGDFRVQTFHGGTDEQFDPASWMVAHASAILDAASRLHGVREHLLYARVDAIERDGKLFLMELELIEPELYLNYKECAANEFAACLKKRLDARYSISQHT